MAATNLKPELFVRRHPAYDGLLAHWSFCEATYNGGRKWFDTNIHRFMREGDKEFADRVLRAYRFNHTREVVDLLTKYIFKAEIDRKTDAPEELQAFWKNATRGGGSIEELMREASKLTSVLGQPYVVVDSSFQLAEGETKISKKEAAERAGRVYAYLVKPQDALDMSYDDQGELNWILFREDHRDDSDFYSANVITTRYRLWDRQGWQLFQVRKASPEEVRSLDNKVSVVGAMLQSFVPSSSSASSAAQDKMVVDLITSGQHGLGVVPVIPVRDRESDNLYSAPALIDDIAYLDRATANYLSNLDAIIQDQTFSILTIPVQSLDKGSAEYETVLEMGTKRLFAYDGEGGTGPEFISPDPSQAQIILAVITKIITEIYHSIGMAGERTKMDNAAGIDNSSGVAKAYDFDRMNTMLKSKADRLCDVENKIVKLVMAWNGQDGFKEDLVTYNDDFDVRNLADEFDVANRLALLIAPPSLRRHQMEQLVRKLYPNLADDLLKKIKAEVQDWGEPPEVDETGAQVTPGTPTRTKPKSENKQGQNNKDA